MRFFEGLAIVFGFYFFCFLLAHFSREFGIKRGRELANKEMNQKLMNCNKIITGK